MREENANFIWRKFQQNSSDYEHQSEPLGQQRRFVEGEIFERKDSETAKTAQEANKCHQKFHQHSQFAVSTNLQSVSSTVRTSFSIIRSTIHTFSLQSVRIRSQYHTQSELFSVIRSTIHAVSLQSVSICSQYYQQKQSP